MTEGEFKFHLLHGMVLILSLTILHDQVEQWAAWRNASKVMLELENELSRFENVPNHRLLLLFSNYQVANCAAPEIIAAVYEKNRKKLNAGWSQRINALRREWEHGKKTSTTTSPVASSISNQSSIE